MTNPEQKKLRILVGLLIVLGITLFIGYRMNRTSNPAIVQAEDQKPVAAPPVQTDARIRLDLLNKEKSDEDLGKKNLFEYGSPAQLPPSAVSTGGNPAKPAMPPNAMGNANVNPNTGLTPVPITRTPPPAPPIPLKYIGFAYVEPNSKRLIATLIDDTQHHFNAVEGDVFMGRYRVLHVTDTSVEVEDLQFNRRQTLPLAKQ